MDNVVADMDAGVYAITGNHEYKRGDWEKVVKHGRLFSQLNKTHFGDEVVDICKSVSAQLDYQVLFLTALPASNDIHWAAWDKIHWAKTYYPGIPVHFGPYASDKRLHCNTGDILIDDTLTNCVDWTAAGGIAIHLTKHNYTAGITRIRELC